MKILHIPYTFYPEPLGGTEIYVMHLMRHLNSHQIQGSILATSAQADTICEETIEGYQIFRFPKSEPSTPQIYSKNNPKQAELFKLFLEAHAFDIIHLHASSFDQPAELLKIAKSKGIKTFITYHTPTVSCMRGTLLEKGVNVCDGRVDPVRCGACQLQGQGVPNALARLLTSTPTLVSRILSRLPGRWGTVLGMRYFAELHKQDVLTRFNFVDQIIVPCEWAKKVMDINDIDLSKVKLCRQGLELHDYVKSDTNRPDHAVPTFGFLGRVDATKGIDKIIDAVLNTPKETQFILDLRMIEPRGNPSYLKKLKMKCDQDSRIQWNQSVPHDQVGSLIASWKAVLIPSQWLETGPLVVYEAFGQGVPVIGSNLGGISELVEHSITGILVDDYKNAKAWQQVLSQVTHYPNILTDMSKNIPTPRTMQQVASEMAQHYRHSLKD